MGIEADTFAVSDGFDGHDVPEVFGDDVGDEEIDFGGGVDGVAGSGGADAVASIGVAGGGFDLDAEKALAEGDDGVVAFTVSPGDADGEAEAGGAGEEGGLGGFSAALAGGSGDGMKGDDWRCGVGRLRVDAAGGDWLDVGWDVGMGNVHNRKGAAGWLRPNAPSPEFYDPENTKSAARRLRFPELFLLYLLSQVAGGKPEKIRTLFLLANVWVGGKQGCWAA
jgi:hypothetical protein